MSIESLLDEFAELACALEGVPPEGIAALEGRARGWLVFKAKDVAIARMLSAAALTHRSLRIRRHATRVRLTRHFEAHNQFVASSVEAKRSLDTTAAELLGIAKRLRKVELHLLRARQKTAMREEVAALVRRLESVDCAAHDARKAQLATLAQELEKALR